MKNPIFTCYYITTMLESTFSSSPKWHLPPLATLPSLLAYWSNAGPGYLTLCCFWQDFVAVTFINKHKINTSFDIYVLLCVYVTVCFKLFCQLLVQVCTNLMKRAGSTYRAAVLSSEGLRGNSATSMSLSLQNDVPASVSFLKTYKIILISVLPYVYVCISIVYNENLE